MNAILMTAVLALGQPDPGVPAPPSTALDGVWTVVALEINGRPTALTERDRALAIRNNTLTLPGVAAIHGTLRLDLGPKGTLLAVPAAAGTGNRRDPTVVEPGTPAAAGTPGTSGTGVVGGASGVYVRTADYLVLTIGDPSAATAAGTGAGPTTDVRPGPDPSGTRAADPATPRADRGTVGTVGQPPVSMVLRRSTGADAPPATAAPPPPATPAPAAPTLRRVSSVVGSNVTLGDGSPAGRVVDVVYSSTGAIDYVVLDNNGTFAPVPWGALHWDAASGVASLPLTRAQFGTVPTFGANDWSNVLTNPGFTQRLQNTFGNFQDASGRPLFNQLGNNAANRTGNPAASPTGNPAGNRAGNPGAVRPGVPPGNPPGAQPKAQPGNQPGAQPKVPPKGPPMGGG
jgi:hypothetical protein